MPSRSTALTDFEWDEGMTMPVANAENKMLENEVSFCLITSIILFELRLFYKLAAMLNYFKFTNKPFIFE